MSELKTAPTATNANPGTIDTIKDKASTAAHATSDAAHDAAKRASDAAHDAAERVSDTIETSPLIRPSHRAAAVCRKPGSSRSLPW